jgi:hypothetical protein
MRSGPASLWQRFKTDSVIDVGEYLKTLPINEISSIPGFAAAHFWYLVLA